MYALCNEYVCTCESIKEAYSSCSTGIYNNDLEELSSSKEANICSDNFLMLNITCGDMILWKLLIL